MRTRRRLYLGLPLLIGSGMLFALLVAPSSFLNLISLLWTFFDELGAGIVRLGSDFWQATPRTLRPLWGVGFCSAAVLMLIGTLMFRVLRRLRDIL